MNETKIKSKKKRKVKKKKLLKNLLEQISLG